MIPVWKLILAPASSEPVGLLVGLRRGTVAAAAGILLLGVSGWFITAAAIAGSTGAFLNIFVPSAIIRALAIIRTAGRYGERVLTHEATFRFLAALRSSLFASYAAKSSGAGRSGVVLNRLTGDIDALDLVYLRLTVPFFVAVASALGLMVFWSAVSREILLVGLAALLAWGLLAGVSVTRSDRRAARRADAARVRP